MSATTSPAGPVLEEREGRTRPFWVLSWLQRYCCEFPV